MGYFFLILVIDLHTKLYIITFWLLINLSINYREECSRFLNIVHKYNAYQAISTKNRQLTCVDRLMAQMC